MNSKTLVSVIIPVYKVEEYLRRCLDSVVAQTYKEIEVILVDDGSPDNCGKICDEYAEKYREFSVIHQMNQGLAAARNNAVKIAKGEFITFIDSDDFVEEDYVEYLLKIQEEYDADVVIGGYKYIYDGDKKPERSGQENTVRMSPEEALICMNYTKGFGATAWAKLYKKTSLLKYPYPPQKLYEDLATTYKIIGDAKTVVFGDRIIYYWVQRMGSIMHQQFDDRQMDGIEAAKAQLKYIENRFPVAIPAAKARYMGKVVELMGLAFHCKESKRYYKILKKEMVYYKDVMRDKSVKKTQKVRLASMKLGYYPAKILFLLHERVKKAIYSR